MKRLYKILRSVAVVILVIAFVLPAGVYVALSVPSVQHAICEGVERELSKLLTVDVEIDHVSITPFNRLTLHRVRVADANGDTAMTVRRIGGGVELWELLSRRRLVMSYAEVIGMDARIYRDSVGGPLNIQPIIDALSPKDKSKPPTRFDFRVNTVVIRTSSVCYDVLSAPEDTARLDVNHIYVSDVKADVQLPRIANDDYTVELRRLAMREKSGLVLERLSGKFHVWNEGATAEGVEVRMPSTCIALGDISTVFGSLKGLKDTWRELPVELKIEEGSYVNPSDFKALAPVLGGLDVKMDVWAHVMGNPESMAVQGVSVASEGLLSLKAEGTVDGMCTGDISVDFPVIELNANGAGVAEVLRGMMPLHENAARVLGNVGGLTLTGDFSGDANAGRVQADVDGTGLGLGLTCDYRRRGAKLPVALKGVLALRDFNGAELLDGTSVNLKELTKVTAEADFDIVMNGKKPSGEVDMLVSTLVYKNHEYTGITSSVSVDGTHYSGSLNVDNPGVMLDVTANADVTAGYKRLDFDVSARDVNPALLNMPGARDGYLLSMFGRGELEGRDADSVVGRIDVNDVTYVDASGRGLRIDNVTVESECADSVNRVTLRSDVADGSATGRYRLTKIPAIAKTIVANVMPKLTGVRAEGTEYKPLTADVADELTFDLTIKDSRPIEELVKLPVKVIYPVSMDGYVNARNQAMGLKMDAPYLQQGNKLIENTALHVNVVQDADVDSVSHADVYFTTMMPTKKGVLTLSTTAAALDDRVDAKLSWKVNRERNFSGDVNVSASFDRDEDNALMTVLDINPSKLVFNDTVWTVDPARITIRGKEAEVRDFRVGRSGQFLTIGGRASAYAGDSIMVELQDVNLDYVFETLDISNAMFGGNATGKIYATELFSKTPRAYTPGLNVARMSYNHSLMGDARIISEWVPETKAITINAEIVQPNGRRSYVSGDIKPMADSLDLHFDADKLEIGFLQPFMSAFATEVSGYASGKARLWGSFKLIDMVGDVYGEDVRLKLGFTNTAYTTTDSVRFTPGRIDLRDLTLYDAYGNTAKLNGWLTHECFKKPRFNFTITDARRMLVYDVKENNDTRWYGRIFGNGGASVTGEPGVVEIGVNMSTAPNSMFTFVLSDELNAQEYNFITFRDRDQARKDSIAALSAPPAAVRELKERLNAGGGDGEGVAVQHVGEAVPLHAVLGVLDLHVGVVQQHQHQAAGLVGGDTLLSGFLAAVGGSLGGGQGGDVLADERVAGGVAIAQVSLGGEGGLITVHSHVYTLAAQGDGNGPVGQGPGAVGKLVIAGVNQHSAVGLEVGGAVVVRVGESAHVLGGGEVLLIGLDEGVGVGVGLALLALHRSHAGVGHPGHHGEGQVKGVHPGHVIGVGGLGVGLSARLVHIGQLDLEAGHAIFLYFLPGAGHIAGSEGGVGGGIGGVEVGEHILVRNSGAVLVQVQQERGVQHGSVLAGFLIGAPELVGLASALAARGLGRLLRGGLGIPAGASAAGGQQSDTHHGCKCE